MNPNSALGKAQIEKLQQLRDLGVCTDESLAAFLREHGQPCSDSTIAKHRQGRRTCPLGLLDYLLKHATPAEQIAILELWARPLGLQVVPRQLTPEERWQLRMAGRELARIGDELELLAGPAPLARRAA